MMTNNDLLYLHKHLAKQDDVAEINIAERFWRPSELLSVVKEAIAARSLKPELEVTQQLEEKPQIRRGLRM